LFGAPRITKDGVTVAKEIELEDKPSDTSRWKYGRNGRHGLLRRSIDH
jgi:hypothetical protein